MVAYALNIDNLGALEGAVKQVTEKQIILFECCVKKCQISIWPKLLPNILAKALAISIFGLSLDQYCGLQY